MIRNLVRASANLDHPSAESEDDGNKRLARFLTGINNEVLKPVLLVIFVIIIVYIPIFIIKKIGILIEYLIYI